MTAGELVVIDASALVEALSQSSQGRKVRERLREVAAHAPAHIDAEILSALGRLHRDGQLEAIELEQCLTELAQMPLRRSELGSLLSGAWARRANLRLVDALYVELASQLQATVITTDKRLARAAPLAEVVQ